MGPLRGTGGEIRKEERREVEKREGGGKVREALPNSCSTIGPLVTVE